MAVVYRPESLEFRDTTWDWHRPYIAGVINVTPDSFSDGGEHFDPDAAVAYGHQLVRDGADLLDIGAESTRPGADPVAARDELARLRPVVAGLRGCGVPLSVDTMKAEVAIACAEAGAEVINDVSGGLFDEAMIRASASVPAYICGHLPGRSPAEAHAKESENLGFEVVLADLDHRLQVLREAGARVIADPGLGFGKGHAANLELCKRAGELSDRLQCAVMVGASRKRFVARYSGFSAPFEIGDRDAATIGASLAAIAGGAQVVRVHNVRAMSAAVRLFTAVRGPR